MRLLAKQPSDRPPSAQAVVEAIKGIERELLTERQKAELSITTPLPPPGDITGGVPSDISNGTGMPQLAAKSLGHRSALAIAAALAVLVLSLAGVGRALLWRRAGKVATAPPVPVAVAVASIEPSPELQEPAPSPNPTRPIVPTKSARTAGREGQDTRRSDRLAP